MQAEAKVEVEQRPDSLYLNLSLNLNLLRSVLLCDDVTYKVIQRRIGDLDLDKLPRCS